MSSDSLPLNHQLILAIESSCDETACALIDMEGKIWADEIYSQQEHTPFGGVIPEIAARHHLALLPQMIKNMLAHHRVIPSHLKAIAASSGPGLIGGLIVGSTLAKGLSLSWDVPFIAINHIEAHALTPRLPEISHSLLEFPYLLLLASGGHCQCIAVEGIGDYRKLGGTIDDAAGEAFDKVGKMLGLGWPGGPAVEKLAREGDPHAFPLPRPLYGRPGCDFSFSGLKTAVSQLLHPYGNQPLPRSFAADIAASFQQAITDIMQNRLKHALAMLPHATALVTAGGVAANKNIRAMMHALAMEHHIPFLAPPLRLCTDNAVMVGWAAVETLQQAAQSDMSIDDMAFKPRPRWPLEEMKQKLMQTHPSI